MKFTVRGKFYLKKKFHHAKSTKSTIMADYFSVFEKN